MTYNYIKKQLIETHCMSKLIFFFQLYPLEIGNEQDFFKVVKLINYLNLNLFSKKQKFDSKNAIYLKIILTKLLSLI